MERTSADREKEKESSSDRQRDGGKESSSSKAESGSVASLHRTVGNQTVQRLYQRGEIQASMAVSQPGDPAEREAERVADEVLRMPKPESVGPLTTTDVNVISRSRSSGPEFDENEAEQIKSLDGGGKPLSYSTRSFFEPRFGRDFSDVRVHTGHKVEEAAQSINARAFTHKNDVVFRQGEFSPDTSEGKRLLAHELTHVVQQDEQDSVGYSSDAIVQRKNGGQSKEGSRVKTAGKDSTGKGGAKQKELQIDPKLYLENKFSSIYRNLIQYYETLHTAVDNTESEIIHENGEIPDEKKVFNVVKSVVDSLVGSAIGAIGGVAPIAGVALNAAFTGLKKSLSGGGGAKGSSAESLIGGLRKNIANEMKNLFGAKEPDKSKITGGEFNKFKTKIYKRFTDIDTGGGGLPDDLIQEMEEGGGYTAKGVAADFFNKLDDWHKKVQKACAIPKAQAITNRIITKILEKGGLLGLSSKFGYYSAGLLTISAEVFRNPEGKITQVNPDDNWKLRTGSPLRKELAPALTDQYSTGKEVLQNVNLKKELYFTIETEARGALDVGGDYQMQGHVLVPKTSNTVQYTVKTQSELEDDMGMLQQVFNSDKVLKEIPARSVGTKL